MFQTGDYIVPRLDYEPYNNKPILTNWLICASYKIFGVSEFSSRLPSALCAILLCVATYLFARRFLSRRVSILSSLMLLSSMLFSTVGPCLADRHASVVFRRRHDVCAIYWGGTPQSGRVDSWSCAPGVIVPHQRSDCAAHGGRTFFLYFSATQVRISPPDILGRFKLSNRCEQFLFFLPSICHGL